MSRVGRVRAEATAAWHSFLRRRVAVFFTFVFPLLLVVIFGAVVQTRPTGGGLFTEPPAYYVAGYLSVVVLFTPLSRVGSEVARHREGARFEKLATTPLTRAEWLLAQTLVNVVIIGVASLLILALVVLATGAAVPANPVVALVVAFVALAVALFCGIGALLGSVVDSQDGVVAASNAIALPLVFLSETFVPPSLLPGWLPTWLSPLTYFARGVRAVTYPAAAGTAWLDLVVLAALTVAFFAAGAIALPQTD
ncbi:MAG: ABC transporter permease [Haloarculaceae archaeon]